jgi:hypothetical protein
MTAEGQEHWQDCQFLRHINRHECVVRLTDSGAVIQIELANPLDVTRACLITPIKPVNAKLCLDANGYSALVYRNCKLEIVWPAHTCIMPPPARYTRKKLNGMPVHKSKRRKIE